MTTTVIVGATYRVGRGCGVPWEWAPMILRVTTADVDTYGTSFLTGYQLNEDGDAIDRRTAVSVITAGLVLLSTPASAAARQRQLRAAQHNSGPRLVPRPRTATDTTTSGRTR